MFALRRRRGGAAVLTVALLSLLAASGSSSADPGQPWTNPNQPPLTRANELLAAMTTAQKIELVTGQFTSPDLESLGIPARRANVRARVPEATQFIVGPHYVVQGTVRLLAG
jgi:hypothetical protein